MPNPNQLHIRREDVVVTAEDLLSLKGIKGAVTEKVRGTILLPATSSTGTRVHFGHHF